MRWLAIALVLLACKRDERRESPVTPAPPVGSYQDLITSTQKGPATETRTELACASQIPVPARQDQDTGTSTSEEELEKRQAELAAMSSDKLAREATADELVSTVTDRLIRALEASKTLSPIERDVWLAITYDGEVNNGGHHQFFYNSTGDEALDVRDALARIGARASLAIYDCALTAFPGNQPARDGGQRNEQLARWGEKQFQIFDRLDSAYYASPSRTPALATYIRAHIAEMPNAR